MTLNTQEATRAMPANLKLQVARMMITSRNPYFTSLVLRMVFKKVEADSQPMGISVSKRGVVYYSEDYIQKLTAEQTGVLLLSKALHILFRHAQRSASMLADPETYNQAADCEIHDDLEAAGWPMDSVDEKGNPCRLLTPSHFKLKNGESAEWYYDELVKQKGLNQKPGVNGGTGRGCGGSGAGGAPSPNEPQGGNQGGGPPDPSVTDPNAPPPEGRSDGELEGMRNDVARALQSASKGKGDIPGGWKVWSDDRLAPPVVKWQDELRATFRAAQRIVAGMVDKTFKKPTRKQAGVGYGPGRPILAGWFKPVPKVMVAIDTSGSMGGLMPGIMGEVSNILKEVKGEVSFCSIDTEIQSAGKTSDWKVIAKACAGGGGTSFIPLFQYIEAMPDSERPNIVVFCTDGCGPAPSDPPRGVHVIWLLIGDYTMRPAPWGKYINAKDGSVEKTPTADEDE